MGRNLTNLFVSESFQYILQRSGSELTDGLGADVDSLNISASYATNAGSANTAVSATSASLATENVVTASAIDTTITFTKGDGSTFDVTVAQSGSVASASYATYAETAGTANTASYVAGANVDGAVANSTDALYAQNTVTTGKNLEATEIAKGTPLYFTGSGTQGNLVGIYRADAGNPARMPAGGVAGEAIAAGAEGRVLLDGYIGGVDTSAFASGDLVYVGVGGGYTNVKPTGSANQIQYLGNVEKSAINGSGVINMMGEAHSVPNIAQDHVWKGDANGVAQAVNQNTLSVSSAATATSASHASTASIVTDSNVAYINQNNTFTGTQSFNDISVSGTGSFGYIQSVTGSAKIIGDAFVQVNTNSPALRYGGIQVVDSGSVAATASLQWDSEQDIWMQEEVDGTTAGLITGLSGSKGSEAFPANNTLVKGTGTHQVSDSSITDDGSTVKINSNTQVTGSHSVSGSLNINGGAFTSLEVGVDSERINFAGNRVDIQANQNLTLEGGNNIILEGNTQITGSLNGSGSVQLIVPTPGANSETHFIEDSVNFTNGWGAAYDAPWLGKLNYPAASAYQNAYSIAYNDAGLTYAYFTELLVGPNRTHFQLNPSGSGGNSNISLQTADGSKTFAAIYADESQLGAFRGDVVIGNASGTTEITGSVGVKDTITLHTVEVTGSLEHSGSQFTVKIPAPSNNVPAGEGYGAEYFLDYENLLSSENQDYNKARLWAYHFTGSKSQDNRLALRKCNDGQQIWSEVFNSGYEVGVEQYTVSGSHGKMTIDTQDNGDGLMKLYAHDMQIGAYVDHSGSMSIGNTGNTGIDIKTGGSITATGSLETTGSFKNIFPVAASGTEIEIFQQNSNWTNSWGATYLKPSIGNQNYTFGTSYENAFAIEYYDAGLTFGWYSEALFGPNRMHMQLKPSGSGNAANIGVQVQNPGAANQETLANIYGDIVHLGVLRGNVEIGNASGTNTIKGSTVVSGSMVGEVNSLSIASQTASLDASNGNYFDLTLVSGSNTHVTVSNVTPGQTYILKTEQPTSATDSHGTITFNSEFKFAGGTAPEATAVSGSTDIYTFVSFDSTNVMSTQVADLK